MDEADLSAIDEGLWETYLAVCNKDDTFPSIKDFYVWVSDNYD